MSHIMSHIVHGAIYKRMQLYSVNMRYSCYRIVKLWHTKHDVIRVELINLRKLYFANKVRLILHITHFYFYEHFTNYCQSQFRLSSVSVLTTIVNRYFVLSILHITISCQVSTKCVSFYPEKDKSTHACIFYKDFSTWLKIKTTTLI